MFSLKSGESSMHCVRCLLFRGFALRYASRSTSSSSSSDKRDYDDGIGNSRAVGEKALKVAVIGCPNVGKSALTNLLIRAPVCAVSRQVDTTRANTVTALTEDSCQLVVVDSPGVIGVRHAKKFIGTNSDAKILADPERAIKYAGHLLVVQDASANGEYIQHRVLHLLHRYSHIPATLVLNKIDLISNRARLLQLADILTEGVVDGVRIESKRSGFGLIDSIQVRNADKSRNIKDASGGFDGRRMEDGLPIHLTSSIKNKDDKWQALYTKLLQRPAHKCSWSETRRLYKDQNGWPYFKSVFFVSSLTGEGVDSLRKYLRELSEPATSWRLEPSTVSTKNPRSILLEHIRSEFLNRLQGYVAYPLGIHTVEWEMDNFSETEHPLLRIIVDVNCDKERIARLVHSCIGEVEEAVTERLQRLFKTPLALRIYVKIRGRAYVAQAPPSDSVTSMKPESTNDHNDGITQRRKLTESNSRSKPSR